jgi:arginyl-tRNA synthetase
MTTIARQLTELVREAAAAAGYGEAPIAIERCVPCGDPAHGDYQSNHAFRVGKALKTNPRAVAEAMRRALPPHPMIARVDVAGPGFLNFRLADSWLADDLAGRARDPWLGAERTGTGKTLVIDYSSPNIAKRMHVGHLRSTVIGAAIARLHAFLGWKVIADNHIGDWGTQFGKLIVAWHAWRDDAAFVGDPIGELQRLYELFAERAKADPTLLEQARAETASLQRGDAANRALWEQFCAVSMQEFDSIYRRMDVKFDVVLGESAYRDELGPLTDELVARGIAIESDGALIIPLGDIDPRLADHPMLVRKRDGAALYGTTDLATARHRLRTWHPDLIVIVTDIRQRGHFDQLFAACRKLGWEGNFVHVGFGMLRLPDGDIVATRTGTGGSLNLKDVLDTAAAHARTVVDAKSGHLPADERAAIAEAVGVGAIRYADLSQNPTSDITFDWSRMLSLEGNTAPYLMYAYARCRNIFVKAGIDAVDPTPPILGEPVERELALAIARLPEAIEEAAGSWRPNALADHLFGLASTLARFYGTCRVLDADVPADVRQSRLVLVQTTARALAIGLDTLGIRALDRM